MTLSQESREKTKPWVPAIQVAAGAVLISFSPVFVNVTDVDPAATAFYRLLIGGIVLLAVAVASRRLRVARKKKLLIAALCGVLVAIDLSVWHMSIRLIGPGLATILGNHQVFVLAGFGIVFLGERLTFRMASAILLAVAGLFLIFGLEWGGLSAEFRLGTIYGGLTALMYGCFLILLRSAQSGTGAPDPVFTVAVLSLVGSAVLGGYVWSGGESFVVPDSRNWTVLICYAIICHVVGWVLITKGLPGLEASKAGLLLLLQPALAFVWDVALFGRPTAVVEVMGAVLALCAIYLGAVGRDERPTYNVEHPTSNGG